MRSVQWVAERTLGALALSDFASWESAMALYLSQFHGVAAAMLREKHWLLTRHWRDTLEKMLPHWQKKPYGWLLLKC
jgi:hypothetical protein